MIKKNHFLNMIKVDYKNTHCWKTENYSTKIRNKIDVHSHHFSLFLEVFAVAISYVNELRVGAFSRN